MKTPKLCVAVLCALAAPVYAGPDWIEVGDAGSSVRTAQPVVGIGTPTHIQGTLSNSLLAAADFEDMYLLRIETPTSFHFDLSGSTFDSMLYLFNVTQADEAFGLLANNDTPTSLGSLINGPNATDNSGAMVLNPGVYALAVTGFNRHPVSRTGDIFFFASNTETSGADGAGGLNPLQGWDGVGATGSYDIELDGIGYVNVPAPSAAVIMATGVGVLMRRRRK